MKATKLLLILLPFAFVLGWSNSIQAQDWLIKRDTWGSIDSLNADYEHTIEYITIHHGGEIYPDDKNTVQYLQNLQSWSRSAKNWIDVPYHYIVDRHGKIYEGRPLNYRGDTNTTYDPTSHALIVLLGNFEEQPLKDEQIASLKVITSFLAKQESVPTEKIKTHKDYAETLCPGKKLTAYLATEDWQVFLKGLK
jgi:hypothetical protein